MYMLKQLNRIDKLVLVCALLVSVLFFALPVRSDARTRPDDAAPLASWYYKWSIDSKAEAEELAEWDILIIDIESAHYSRNRLEYIKELHPQIKFLAYISMTDLLPTAANLDEGTTRKEIGEMLEEHPEWLLRTADGDTAHWWQDYYVYNITNKAPEVDGDRFNEWFAKLMRDTVVEDDLWDGIFFDNLWEGISFVGDDIDTNNDGIAESKKAMNKQWRKGVRTILRKTKSYANNEGRKKFIITGNGGTRYHKNVHGIGFEHFPNTVYGDWVDSMEEYNFILSGDTRTQYAFLNSNTGNTGARTDYRKFRYGLMSALLNDGYYHFDDGDGSHTQAWYYDEYEVSLGAPRGAAYNLLDLSNSTALKEGVWRRDYDEVSVIVNSTDQDQRVRLGSGFEKINGTQDTSTNNGQRIGSVTIPARDGIMLLHALTTIDNATFVNGAFTKIFGWNGNEKRNSFFAFDSRYSGQTQVHRISKNNKTVVAGDTYVDVYNGANKRVARFAPYGEGYTDGINVAVSNLYGGKKKYIVTGNKRGRARVRIFDMAGNVVNDGCYPYAPGFQGGVNVGVGNVMGGKSQEIVVAAGFGGGPHVRILSNNCTVLHPGFFAYEEHLRIGVNMAVGDINGDGRSEIVTGAGPGGGPHVRIFNKDGKLLSPGFFAYDKSDRSGVLVSTADTDDDGKDEIITSSFAIFEGF